MNLKKAAKKMGLNLQKAKDVEVTTRPSYSSTLKADYQEFERHEN
jgi:hypothetical protein